MLDFWGVLDFRFLGGAFWCSGCSILGILVLWMLDFSALDVNRMANGWHSCGAHATPRLPRSHETDWLTTSSFIFSNPIRQKLCVRERPF